MCVPAILFICLGIYSSTLAINNTIVLFIDSIDTTYRYHEQLKVPSVRMFLFIRNTESAINTGCSLATDKNTIDLQRKNCVYFELTNELSGKVFRTDIDVKDEHQIQYDLVRESFSGRVASEIGFVAKVGSLVTKNKAVKVGSEILKIFLEGIPYEVDASVLSQLGVVGLSHVKNSIGNGISTTDIELKEGDTFKETFEAKGREISIAASPEIGLKYASVLGVQLVSFDFNSDVIQPLLAKMIIINDGMSVH